MLLHEASDGLDLGVDGLGAKDLAEHPRCSAGDQCVLHIDALLALLKDEAEELLFDGHNLSGRAIEESLPLLGSTLCPDGGADCGNFLAPLGQKWEGHTEDFTSLVEGEITLPPQAVALLQKQDLLDESIPLADLPGCSPRQPEEEGARHHKREQKHFFDQMDGFGEEGV
jgi:hypothetical protein